jgi:hypothetical protein
MHRFSLVAAIMAMVLSGVVAAAQEGTPAVGVESAEHGAFPANAPALDR